MPFEMREQKKLIAALEIGYDPALIAADQFAPQVLPSVAENLSRRIRQAEEIEAGQQYAFDPAVAVYQTPEDLALVLEGGSAAVGWPGSPLIPAKTAPSCGRRRLLVALLTVHFDPQEVSVAYPPEPGARLGLNDMAEYLSAILAPRGLEGEQQPVSEGWWFGEDMTLYPEATAALLDARDGAELWRRVDGATGVPIHPLWGNIQDALPFP